MMEPRIGVLCSEGLDYSSLCICDSWPYTTINIFCNISSEGDWQVLTEAFSKTNITEHFELRLTLSQSGLIIPANVLSDKSALIIIIQCADDSFVLESVHPNAFAASATKASSLMIDSCSLPNFDFAFLDQLNENLETLRLHKVALNKLELMPRLPKLRMLELFGIRGLKSLWLDAGDPAQLITPLLETVIISSIADISEADVDAMGELLQLYEHSLRHLYLVELGLNKVPQIARQLHNLWTLDLSENQMTDLPDGSMALNSALSTLRLWNIPLQTIHPNAFQGLN